MSEVVFRGIFHYIPSYFFVRSQTEMQQIDDVVAQKDLIFQDYLLDRVARRDKQKDKMSDIDNAIKNLSEDIKAMMTAILKANPDSPIKKKPLWEAYQKAEKRPFKSAGSTFSSYLIMHKARILYYLEMADYFDGIDKLATKASERYPDYIRTDTGTLSLQILPPYTSDPELMTDFSSGSIPVKQMIEFARRIRVGAANFRKAHMIDDTHYIDTTNKLLNRICGISRGYGNDATIQGAKQIILTMCKGFFRAMAYCTTPGIEEAAAVIHQAVDESKDSIANFGVKDSFEGLKALASRATSNVKEIPSDAPNKGAALRIEKLVNDTIGKIGKSIEEGESFTGGESISSNTKTKTRKRQEIMINGDIKIVEEEEKEKEEKEKEGKEEKSEKEHEDGKEREEEKEKEAEAK